MPGSTWKYKIYGLSVQEGLERVARLAPCHGHARAIIHLASEVYGASRPHHPVPGSVGAEGAVESVSLLTRGLKFC